jgi:GTP-binding protein HflX
LEEVQRASLILHVSDASSPLSTEQDIQVEKVLKELESDNKPRLRVMNKIDLLAPGQDNQRNDAQTIYVSAAKGIGISSLLEKIDEVLQEDRPSRIRLKIPQKEGKALAFLESKAQIFSRKYKEDSVELEINAAESVLRSVRKWQMPDQVAKLRRSARTQPTA